MNFKPPISDQSRNELCLKRLLWFLIILHSPVVWEGLEMPVPIPVLIAISTADGDGIANYPHMSYSALETRKLLIFTENFLLFTSDHQLNKWIVESLLPLIA